MTSQNTSSSFKPLQNGAVLRSSSPPGSSRWPSRVSNPFKTGRYCVGGDGTKVLYRRLGFQTPSKRGGTA